MFTKHCSKLICCKDSVFCVVILYFIILEVTMISCYVKYYKKWHIGRVPPSRFEYDKLNGYYSIKHAKQMCENDFQCGGFTFKGTKRDKMKRAVYFFHFINFENEYMKYPHWTSYIPDRPYVILSGNYLSESGNLLHTTNVSVSYTHLTLPTKA